MTKYALSLKLDYSFDRPTGAGRQLLRVLPAYIPALQDFSILKLEITPEPVELGRFHDFFDIEVLELAMAAGLTQFTLEMQAEVTRNARPLGPDRSGPPAALAQALRDIQDISAHSPQHFRFPSRRVVPDADITAFAAKLCQSGSTLELIEGLGRAIHDHMTFDADATEVDTAPAEAFRLKRGVCQDFAHIMIAGLRSRGVPAGYVAGYLRTLPPKGKPRLIGADAMHAWVRAWAGPAMGWVDYDPTNACFPSSDHIDVGFGRDYDDVAPVTGMWRLDGGQSGHHSVDIEALDSHPTSPAKKRGQIG